MLKRLASDTHEELYRVEDTETGLCGFIALHSTARGPAAGGLRMRRYGSEEEAIQDVLNLSRGMSYKNAAAGLPLGGGKAVIIGDPARDKQPALLHAFGRAIEALEGRYWTAEDMGMTPADMAELARETRYVAGRDSGAHASGDPSPVTARGVYNAMLTGAERVFGTRDLSGRHIAVQGLGHVGWNLCMLLHDAGARLSVTDIDAGRIDAAFRAFRAAPVALDSIQTERADIFAPCAIGGVLDERTVRALNVRLVAGAANNQLATPEMADALHARGILYLPDYVANAGGIVNVAAEILQIEGREAWVASKLEALEATMERILTRAEAENVSPAHLADRIVGEAMLRKAS